MAWISSETKMDTGQLYVSTDDGKTFQKVCEVREVKTAQDTLEHEEKVKNNLSHLIYILTMLGTNDNISIEKRRWCCDQLAEMYVNGDFKEVMDHVYLVMPRRNGKILFQHMLMERIHQLQGLAYLKKHAVDLEADGWIHELHQPIQIRGFNHDDILDSTSYAMNYIKDLSFGFEQTNNPFAVVKLDNNNEKEKKTMEAKKCDRCGKLYELPTAGENGNGAEVRFKYKYIRRAENMSEKAIADEQTRNIFVKCYCGDEVDFCPECRASLKKWWENTNE